MTTASHEDNRQKMKNLENLIARVYEVSDSIDHMPGFSQQETRLMIALHTGRNGQTMGELASTLKISRPWATRVVSELENKGAVSVTRDRDDFRARKVSLATDLSRQLDQYEKKMLSKADSIMQLISAEDLETTEAVLRRILTAIDGSDAASDSIDSEVIDNA